MPEKTIRVLYIDDNQMDRELVRDSLAQEKGEFLLTEASSRVEFEDRLAENDYDLILSDFNILGLDGLDVLKIVRDRTPHTPVVIVTGTGSEEIAVKALKQGAADYVIKTPGHIRRLPLTLRSVMEKARQQEEHKLTFEQLLVSEAKFRSIVRNAEIAIICAHDDGTIFLWNESAQRMFGYREEDILGKSLTLLMPERYHDRHKAGLARPITTGRSEKSKGARQMHGLRVDGSEFPIELSLGSWVSTEGTHYVGLIHDTSSRQKAKEKLEQLLHHTQERVKELRCMFRVAESIRRRSTLSDIFQDTAELIPQGWQYPKMTRARIHFDDQEYVSQAFEDTEWCLAADMVILGKRRGKIEIFYLEKFPEEDEGPFLEEERDLIDNLAGTLSEAISHKIADNALRESSERLQLALEGAELGTWDRDLNSGRVVYGERCAEMLGYSLAETDTDLNAWEKQVHPDDLPQVLETLDAHLAGKIPIYESEYRLKHKSGRWVWVHDRGKVVSRGKDGEALRIIGTHLDITRRIELAEERGKLEAQLRRAQKMEAIGTLAGGIAHDFNNILMPILGYTDLALGQVGDEGKIKGHLLQVVKAAQRARELVKQILTFSRQGTEERLPVLLAPILKEVLKLLRATLPTTIEIRKQIDVGCPPVAASATQMHQVMMNLCTNAYQAMEKIGGVLEVSLDTVDLDAAFTHVHPGLQQGAHVRISVRDTGPGMSQDIMEKIFEPFFTTKEQGKGTGLGLSVVHGIVVNHGGAISVYSEPGEGAVFHVYLPVMGEEVAATVSEPEGPEGGSEVILFVDDEAQIVTLGKEMLEALGYTVSTSSSALGALELFRENPDKFDVVITDQTMPGMTGTQLAGVLTEIRPQIPVILISGFSENLPDEKKPIAGIRERLTKPILGKDMAAAIRRVLDREAPE